MIHPTERKTFQVCHARRWAAIVFLLAGIAFFGGCTSGVNACASGSSSSPEFTCYQNFAESDCSTYNSENVNGGKWTWYPGKTCADVGYSYWCGRNGASSSSYNGYWTTMATFCIY